MIANSDIRSEAKAADVKLWQIAELFHLNDGNFSRKLRHELPIEEKAKIRAIIRKISTEFVRKGKITGLNQRYVMLKEDDNEQIYYTNKCLKEIKL